MSNKKFELTENTKIYRGRTLHRIEALVDFGNVKAGDLGGYIEKEENLSVAGNAWVSLNDDYVCFQGFGSYNRTTTFYKTKDNGVGVVCDCFIGTLEEFEKQVVKTHGNNKYAGEYLKIAELVKIHFELEEKNNE